MLINEREYQLSFTGETLLIYKEQFHRDFLLTISDSANYISDYELLFGVIWALAKTGNSECESYEDFMKSLTPTTIRQLVGIETIKTINSVINGDMETSVESKKK